MEYKKRDRETGRKKGHGESPVNSKYMIKTFLLALFLIGSISFTSMQISYALFSDSAQSTSNTFSASSEFPLTAPLTSAMLKINEVYVDGVSAGEWVEIFNPTAFIVDISGWSISDALSTDIIPSVSPLSPGEYVIITGSDSSVSVPVTAKHAVLSNSTIGNGLNDTGDRLILRDLSSSEIDSLSYGSDAFIFPAPPISPQIGESLSRNPNGIDSNSSLDWIIDTTPSIGIANN